MNVLLTSVGRRSYLVQYFREALQGRGKVVGANMYADAPGMYACDVAVRVPPASDPDYVDRILHICREHDIGLLCSLHDLDVYILSQNRDAFEAAGIATTLPSAEWGRITLDKYLCGKTLDDNGIAVPWTTTSPEHAIQAIRDGLFDYPLIVKARFGFGSLGLRLCHSEPDLWNAYRDARQQSLDAGHKEFFGEMADELVLIQPWIRGREICIGIVNDFSGTYRSHFACEVHSMRAGESDRTTSLDRDSFATVALDFSRLTKHSGIWGIDCLDDNGTIRVIDVNPRFTGDYPFHHLAGANIPAALVAWASGEMANDEFFHSRPGVMSYKDIVPKRAK